MKQYPEAVWKKLEEIELTMEEGNNLLFELDKLIPQEPIKTGVDIYKGFFIDTFACPKCGRAIGDDMIIFPHCPACGKAIKK